MAEFIHFLPVLAYDGSTMRQISAQDVLDIALAGTSATLLARRWESALLVNVDNDTLSRLLANKEALDALMRIEGFRSLNQDIETIINKSEKVKKAKQDGDEKTPKEKKELSEEEKEYKSLRKQIQEKLIKFATRIPIFMYLTDYREKSLEDVITQLEPGLFKKVTGLDVKDFDTLTSIGVFNRSLMNDAVFKFKRYEDSSLSYTGIDKHEGKDIGGWDTVIKREEYEKLFYNQQATMETPAPREPEEPEEPEEPVVVPQPVPEPPRTQTNLITERFGVRPPVSAAAESRSSYGIRRPSFLSRPTKKEEPPVDCSAYTVGAKVTHKTFGEGTIHKIDKAQKYIWVVFSGGEKKFLYPDAIQKGILKL